MPFRNSQAASGFQPDDLGKTPEERRSLDQLFSVTYEELRRLASSVKRSDPGATLSPTTMVNEAWVKLAKSPQFASTSRLHFKRIAARAMRQVLVEAARRRNASKRGGDEGVTVITFDESQQVKASCGQDLLAMDTALGELARLQPRQAMMVESRFFGGLDVTETAALLDVSEATILRDWRAAKAWLAHELRRVS
jgi:RNA polymerase sigma factor (TIGR02999 family)